MSVKYEILAEDGTTVLNTITADSDAWVAAHYPNWRHAAPAPEVQPDAKLRKLAFARRFPPSGVGVASKFDLLTLFLRDDGYASSLMPDPIARLTLRANIVAGMNLLDAATHVTLTLPYAAEFTGMLLDEGIPAPFRLTAPERDSILSLTIADDERP